MSAFRGIGLRGELGFEGPVITDDLQAVAIAKRYKQADAITLALKAGADLLLFAAPTSKSTFYHDLVTTIETLVKTGKVPESRIDQAVVHDDLSPPQELEPSHRHETRIARARADERDRADSHDSAPSSSSSRCLASSRPRSTMSRRTSGPSARRQASAVTGRPAARSSRLASAAIEASVV